MSTFIDTQQGRFEVRFEQFPDGEYHCEIDNLENITNNVLVVHSLYPNPEIELIKLFLVLGQLGSRNISVFVPYLPYSRQDSNKGAETICSLIANAGCRALYTLDCHFMKGAEYTSKYKLSVFNILAKKHLINRIPAIVTLLSPDKGAAHLAEGNHLAKVRKNGKVVSLGFDNTIIAKNMAIIDDMISTGTTMFEAALLLKGTGTVENIYFVATHGFFLENSKEKLDELGVATITTDSVSDKAQVSVTEIYEQDVKPLWFTHLHSN